MEHPPFGLTATQRDALLVIQELTGLYGIAPTYREIAHELDLASCSRLTELAYILRDKGFIDFLPYRARSIIVRRAIPMPEEPAIEVLAR